MCSQQSKTSGFTRNRKLEQLVTNAVLAAEQIADEHVSLPTQPEQPALVTSQRDQSIRYRVTDACTETASCSCPQGTLGYLCKHRVKVIGLVTQCKKQDIVLFLGTWAGSSRGGMQQLLNRGQTDVQPELDNWQQLTENLQLEDEAQQHDQGSSSMTDSDSQTVEPTAGNSAAQPKPASDADMLAQFQRLQQESKGSADMRNILLNKLNQAEGSFQKLAAQNLAGLSQAAHTIEKVQDGLPDSTVRLKSALEGSFKPRRKVKQTALIASTSTLPAVQPLPKPQPSRKKRTFAQLLTSGRHAGKENSSAVANSAPCNAAAGLSNIDAAAASNVAGAEAPVSVATSTAVLCSAASQRSGPQQAGMTATNTAKSGRQSKVSRCGHCKNCLRPKNKQKCLTLAAEKAVLLPTT